METVSRVPSRKTNARKLAARAEQPVVDVPKAATSDSKIKTFIAENGKTIRAYVKENFDGVEDNDVTAIVRECAECVVLTRSPKKGGPWGDDTAIIEDILKSAGVSTEMDESEEDEAEDVEDIHASDDARSDDEAEEEEPEVKAEAPQEKPRTKAVETKAKKEPKTTKAKSTATQTKAAKPTKAQPKATAPKKKAKEKSPAKTSKSKEKKATKAVSVEVLKTFSGKKQWMEAARFLKSQKKIWIQAQDMEEVIGHLFDVNSGKAKLKEEGFDGKGEKSYRKQRLQKISNAITELLNKVD